jgi:3-oxoacyl-[acyl-carrier-protein] synthase I
MNRAPVFIADYAMVCALGDCNEAIAANLFAPAPPLVAGVAHLSDGRAMPVGAVTAALAEPAHESRTNQLIAHCYAPLSARVEALRARFGAARLGIVIGTSTSGIGEAGAAFTAKVRGEVWPASFSLRQQSLGDAARFAAQLAGAEGPSYAVSTACTSGARAMIAGARLLQAGLCDAVLCGGADSLGGLTLNGFAALDALSDAPSNPMSANRKGLNIGEGCALFVLTRESGPFRLAGWGESADGHHMSAPDPAGGGADSAMRTALARAGCEASAIDFVHLHGTATKLNDQMEAGVVHRLFGAETPCASTKPLTGHTLGAAGALQAGLCLLAIAQGRLPPHVWDGERDPELARIRLAAPGERARLAHIVSASYAFGGNNAALVLAAA